MSLYTTPLQFGYFFCLVMWILFLIRGYRNQRLSDKLLGWILFILAMELQDYTFGFAGINILWDQLNGFPRGVSLLFGPIVYFYFKSQVDRSFTITKSHLWHFLPYLIYFLYEFSAFIQGAEIVNQRYESQLNLVLGYVLQLVRWSSYVFYLSRCLLIYKKYRAWSLHQFSNTDLISFNWFRNFIYAMIFWLLFREVMNLLDAFMNLDFYQDWWWNLALVVVSFYIGLAGYEQKQPAKIFFIQKSLDGNSKSSPNQVDEIKNQNGALEKAETANKLKNVMKEDKLFLQPDLNLQELALHLQVNSVQLSATINQVFDQNFNDYVNSLRIEEFIRLYALDESKAFTMLAIALDSGFNSKATFNRAFKKIKGSSPKEFLSSYT